MEVSRTRPPTKVLPLLIQREEDPAWCVGFQPHLPPSSPGASGVPITSAPRGGYPKSLGRIVGAAGASEVQSSWFTLQGVTKGILVAGGEKRKDPAPWALQKKDGCRRRGLSLVIVIAGELDQQAIFSHLSRKIQVRANS